VSEARLGTGPTASAHLSTEEVAERIESVSAADKVRLRLLERRRLGGTDYSERTLLHEAMCQALLGERLCPREVPMVAFLAETMRSLASHRRASLKRQVPLDAVRQTAADQLGPEDALLEREASDVVDAVLDCLDGDEEAQKAVIAITGENKGKALRDELGVDQAGYDYIVKRIKRAMKKKFPKGLPS
jgi:DNA-directed RNA polymerase specialized sigma24 family protein